MQSIIDLHMHSAASDGSDHPEVLVKQITEQGIRVFSLTDHDTVSGIAALLPLVPPEVRFIPGVEFSCVSDMGKCHILGYNYDPRNPVFQAALQKGRDLRREKLDKRLRYLMDEKGVPISDDEIATFYRMKSVGKPHLANLLIQKGVARTREEAIRRFINPSGTEDMCIEAAMAIGAILEAGGIPVWAHPLGGEGEKKLTWEQFHAQLSFLITKGIRGLECYYSRYTMEEIRELVRTAESYRLYISGGSDYHGSNKDILPGELNCENIPVDTGSLSIMKAF
ncbi:MAG: PHP domain-containing protein [Eubacteriales bacterium]|nr:PHP domain-containing protein [Eubacteriales bacterium]